MKASEVISHLKTIIHHQGDVRVEGYNKDGVRAPVEPKTIEYLDGANPFILITAPPVSGAKE